MRRSGVGKIYVVLCGLLALVGGFGETVATKKDTEVIGNRSSKNPFDEKILQRLIGVNDSLMKVMRVFLNCYDSLHKIKLDITNWYKEIEGSEGFNECRESIIQRRVRNGIWCGDDYDAVKEFCSGKEDYEKAERFRSELRRSVGRLFLDLGEIHCPIYELDCGSWMDDIQENDVSNKIREILNIQKAFSFGLTTDLANVEE